MFSLVVLLFGFVTQPASPSFALLQRPGREEEEGWRSGREVRRLHGPLLYDHKMKKKHQAR